MDLSTLYRIFIDHSHESMSFIYHGDFHDDITGMIIDLSSSNLSNNEQGWVNNKVSFLIAECFQNILQQRGTEETVGHKSLFSIRDISGSIYISSLSPIKKDQIEELSAFIDNINQLDKDQLKQLYLDYLTSDDQSQGNGKARQSGGLGLIEMARKSGNKLAYYFDTFEDLTLFYFQIQFNTKKKESQLQNRINYEISKQTYHLIKRHRIYMVHKGNFSQDTVFPIIEMAEKNLDKHLDPSNKKRTFHVLVELLQNISKHGYASNDLHEGIFMLTGEKGYFNILAGNYVENERVQKLKLILDFINFNTREDVIEYYKGVLRYGQPTEKGGAGIGLIDILRNSAGTLEYQIYKINEKLSFYCIKVRIGLT